MIITKIQGGLGNQMFQYAYGRHLSYKNNTNFYLDISFYDNQQLMGVKRKFQLNEMHNTHIYTNVESLNGKLLYKINDDFRYKNLTLGDDHYYLDGYWQSEKYFIESEDIIRSDFSAANDLMIDLKSTPLIDTNTLSLHVRRTDYVKSVQHPVQPIEYYKKAVDAIGDYDHIFVFSDDINWCKDNLKFRNIIFIEGYSDIESLYLMSLCKNNIIANSSFSWWGAWLNNNKDKKVVAPSKWFADNVNINQSDIIPDSWIKI